MVNAISYSKYGNTTLITKVLEKCLSLQEDSEPNGLSIKSLRAVDIINLFDKIYNNCNKDIVLSAKREVQFLPFFKHHATPNNILCFFKNYPENYVMLLVEKFGLDHLENNAVTENKRRFESTAYVILECFCKIPGCINNQISKEIFYNWVYRCKCYAEKAKCNKALELGLGKLLSYSSRGSDSFFSHEFVRDYLEENESEALTREFIIGKLNLRGVHTVTGGLGEKEIALSYYKDAEKIRVSYPVTAAILDTLGDDYKSGSLYERKRVLMDFR